MVTLNQRGDCQASRPQRDKQFEGPRAVRMDRPVARAKVPVLAASTASFLSSLLLPRLISRFLGTLRFTPLQRFTWRAIISVGVT